MQHYVLKDKNGYVKSFKLGDESKTVMCKLLCDAHVFRKDDVHLLVLNSMHKDLGLVEVVESFIKMPENKTKRIVKEVYQSEPTNKQIGGNHYQSLAIQPVEYTVKNQLSFLQGNVIKYITRYKAKNGLQDLQKAKHYIDLIIQFEYIDK